MIESGRPDARIFFENIIINGHPAHMLLDTGSPMAVLLDSGANRLGLKYPTTLAQTFNEHGTMHLTDPTIIIAGGQPFTTEIPVVDLSWFSRWDFGKIDGLMGWPEVRDNIMVFDPARRMVSAVAELPPETAGWLKLKIRPADVLLLETLLPGGKTGTIQVDTGSAYGVELPPAQFNEWKAAHPDVASTSRTLSIPGVEMQRTELARADKIKLGEITLVDVLLSKLGPVNGKDPDNYIGSLGLEALARMDLIVDGPNGFAYVRPKATGEVVEKADWTVADNVRLNSGVILAVSALRNAYLKLAKGDYDGAIADCTKALEFDSKNADAYFNRGTAKLEKNQFDESIADLDHALELNPEDGRAYSNRGAAKLEKADFDAAMEDFDRALELDPKNAAAWSMLGHLQQKRGAFDDAIASFNRILAFDPKNASAYRSRSWTKIMKDDVNSALVDLGDALRLDSKDEDIYRDFAVANEIQGNFPSALADYDKAIELKPDDTPYSRLYRQLLQIRLGKTPPGFAKIVAGWKDDWTKSLGQFVAGEVDETGLLAAAAKKGDETVSGQLCEADYFIGMMRLLKDDKTGARDFFQKSLATKETSYNEYQLARAELARLDAVDKK